MRELSTVTPTAGLRVQEPLRFLADVRKSLWIESQGSRAKEIRVRPYCGRRNNENRPENIIISGICDRGGSEDILPTALIALFIGTSGTR